MFEYCIAACSFGACCDGIRLKSFEACFREPTEPRGEARNGSPRKVTGHSGGRVDIAWLRRGSQGAGEAGRGSPTEKCQSFVHARTMNTSVPLGVTSCVVLSFVPGAEACGDCLNKACLIRDRRQFTRLPASAAANSAPQTLSAHETAGPQ